MATCGELAGGVAASVTTPVRIWMDLASMLDWHDLTIIGDFLLGGRMLLATIAELTEAGRRMHGNRGARA